MKSLTFNGIEKPWLYLLEGRQKSPYAPRQTNLIRVPGRPGAYTQSIDTDVLMIKQPIGFVVNNDHEEQLILDELKSWLLINEDKPLQFSDEPDRIYYAKLDGSMDDYTKIVKLRSGTLTFICPDPYKYGHEQTEIIPYDGKVIANEGTAESYPIFKTTVTGGGSSRVFFRNSSNKTPFGTNKMVVLGYPQSPAQTEIDPLELIMHDSMTSTSSWQTATEVDNGYIAGEMDVNSHGFYARLYGDAIDMKRWQGPSMKRAIGQSLQDFRIDIFIRQMNASAETGMIEIYFRDANGNRVAKIGFEDAWTNATENQGKARIGTGSNYHDIYTSPDYPNGWNNFDGIMRIEREGNVWKPYFAKIINGKHDWVRGNLRYTDNIGNATAPITEVQVAIRKYPGTDETDMSINEIKIYKVNQITDHTTQVRKMFKAGDEIEVVTGTGLVLVNGEQRTDLIELRTDFFSLVPGLNRMYCTYETEVIWTDRYL